MVIAVGALVEKALADIGMNASRAVIRLECGFEEEWLNLLEEGWRTQIVEQGVEWLTRPDPEDEVPNIDWIIAVFPGNKKDDGKSYPSIKSWAQPVGALKDLLKIDAN